MESGAFLFDIAGTQDKVGAFLKALVRVHPSVADLTLSSTHLPWFRTFIERARPDWRLFDPLEDAIEAIMPHATEGPGMVLALVTEDERFSTANFRSMLDRLGVSLSFYTVRA